MLATNSRLPANRAVKLETSSTLGATIHAIPSGVVWKTLRPAPPPASPSRTAPLSRRQWIHIATAHQRMEMAPRRRSSLGAKASGCSLDIKPAVVVWRGWEPGEEYTKNITLKNTHIKTQKIRYKVPSTRFFSTLFPQVIVLSTGTSFTLPLTFKPLKKVHYEDTIEFSTSERKFSIFLQALLPETNLLLPESLQFGLVAAHDSLEISFQIRNASTELMTSYSWEVPDAFTILPPTGSIPPRGSCTLKAIFRPLSASVFESYAICCYGEDNLQKKVKLEGIGKFPYLSIATTDNLSSELNSIPVLDFRGVKVYEIAVKTMILQNFSNVRVPYKIEQSGFTPQIDKAFSCPIHEGIVPPLSKVKIPISFNPSVVGQTSINYFEICQVGVNTKSVIKCQGFCKGPTVTLSTTLLNFGLVHREKRVIKTVDLINMSQCNAAFQIMLDSDTSVWCVTESSGILNAGETRTFHVYFTPVHPINYYRRLSVLVHDQGPLFLDLIGTCHTAEHQPPLLKPMHLERYKIHAARGLSFYSPEILFNQIEEKRIKVDPNGCLTSAIDSDVDLQPITDPPMTEYFDDAHNSEITHCPPHVSLEKLEIWLGRVNFKDDGREPSHATVRMTNHTRGKITAVWIQDPSNVFEIVPPVCDIPPLKSSDFRVVFRPSAPNEFFGAELECYAFYKSMRDYKLVDDTTITPPWCLTVSVSGHTFNGKNDTFLPQVELGSDEITFSASSDKDASYRTVLMKNNGTTPILYQFNQNATEDESSFTMKPCKGMMKSKYQISVCRLKPQKMQLYQAKVTLRLNDNDNHYQNITLLGTGEQPELFLSNNAEMYFRPSCVGTTNSNKYAVQNSGRLPIGFMWKIPISESKRISVEPKQGSILPNEIQNHTWTFSPNAAEKYIFKPVCYTWPLSDNLSHITSFNDIPLKNSRKFVLTIIGEGHLGDLMAEQSSIDFSCVICGLNASNSLILKNTSYCDLRFQLSIEQHINSQYGEHPDENEPIALHMSKETDVLPARSRTAITMTASPRRRVLYTWSLFYEIINERGENIDLNNKILLCELTAEGVYPSLSVIDARTSGSGASVSKTQLWRWFSLDGLNSALDADPEKQELQCSVSTRRSTSRRPDIHTRSVLEFNFGAAPLDSESCFVSVMLKNTGAVVTEWGFLFPKDMQISMDYWTETGILDADELHEVHIQDNKLFTVSPKKGMLNPGENQTILLQYKHDIAGTHRIPVLFKVENGREILLNFVGVTVEPNRRYIHFPGTKHHFTPVPVGGPTPPKQLYEIYNGGSMAVVYELNVAPLLELQTENFDHPILTCLNPQGEVLPGTCTNIEFVFSPLEAKTFMVDIPIHIVGGDVALIAFTGIGYDTRTVGSNMPMLDQPSEFTGVPVTQSVYMPGQHVFVSQERLSFGNTPLFSRNRHVFFLMNTSQDRPVMFSWHASSETVNDVLRIEPVRGRLEPGEHLLTKVTFCAAGLPSFYDLDLICEIIDEVKMEEYQVELFSWEEEKARQEVEFTIVEEEPQKQQEQEDPAHRMPPLRKLPLENILNKNFSPIKLTESVAPHKQQKSITKKYETLPPIRFEDPLRLPSDRTRANRKNRVGLEDDEWPQPQPPEPFVCHLGITARTHDINEFRNNFSQDGSKHYIDRTLQVSLPVISRPPSEQYILTTCDHEERDTVMSVVSRLIRSLLDEPTFHESVRDILKEKTPFFRQLAVEDQDKVAMQLDSDKSRIHDSKKTRKSKVPLLMDQILRQGEEVAANENVSNQKDTELPRSRDCHSRHSSDSSTQSHTNSIVSSSASQRVKLDREIKSSPIFGSLLEDILSSTLSNIMTEAVGGEVVLTARPRLVALPPSTTKPELIQQPHSVQTNSGSSRMSNSSGSKKRQSRSHTGSIGSQSAHASVGKK